MEPGTRYDILVAGEINPDLILSGDVIPEFGQREAVSLTGAENAEEAASRLGRKVEAAAVKLGAQGAIGVRQSQKVRVASVPVQGVDTVGAGDSFDAGFLYGYLNGWELEKALQLACACGALSTQKPGGTNGQPALDEAMKYGSS